MFDFIQTPLLAINVSQGNHRASLSSDIDTESKASRAGIF